MRGTQLDLLGPEALVDFGCFFFDQGAGDLDGSLAAGEDFSAGQVQSRVFGIAAGLLEQAFFRQSVDYAAYADPVDGSGAHGAGFGAGVEGAFGQDFFAEELGGLGAGQALGVLGRFAFGTDGVVAGGDEDLAVFVDNDAAERVGSVPPCFASQVDGLAEEGQVLFGDGYFNHGNFILAWCVRAQKLGRISFIRVSEIPRIAGKEKNANGKRK